MTWSRQRTVRVGLAAVAAVTGTVLAGCEGGEEAATSVSQVVSTTTSSAPEPTSTTEAGQPPTTAAESSAVTTAPRGPVPTQPGSTSPAAEVPRDMPPEGFSLRHPEGWGAAGLVQATAFAAGATCSSSLIVDRAPPPDAGLGASVEQSFVQVCWKGQEGKSLAEFMAATYGGGGGFQPTTLAGRPALVSRAGTSATYFVDTRSRRYQVVTGVAASEGLRATRLAQVDQVLGSLTFNG